MKNYEELVSRYNVLIKRLKDVPSSSELHHISQSKDLSEYQTIIDLDWAVSTLEKQLEKYGYGDERYESFKEIPIYADMIYLISNGSHIKIGVSNNIIKRIKQLQTGSSVRLQLLFTVVTKNAYDLEKYLHIKYSKKRVNGEWFDLNTNEVYDCMNECLSSIN